ncbi:MAG: septum formation protein Maf [Clostridia bacterium]|nr:septum formation protein Maf [Clostridia bacterium]
MRKIYLASKSPRRREILDTMGMDYEVVEGDCPEKVNPWERPDQVVMSIALQKGLSAAEKFNKGELIISADTVVVSEGKILGKPKDAEDARAMLRSLSGKTHQVMTGFSIIEAGQHMKMVDYVVTEVTFKDYDDQVVNWYIESGEPFDKAGAYGIQGKGALLVENIRGDYLNVVGFPISRIVDTLERYFDYSFA